MRRLTATALLTAAAVLIGSAAGPLEPPETFLGFRVGADNRLARWDRIVDYMQQAAAASDRVAYRELGKTTGGQPFILLEISAPETIRDLDRYRDLERRLYFQDGTPTNAEKEALFREGKVVVLVTCSIHATEIGATQMSLELVHRLATDDSPKIRKILDNVIFLLVPSLNPDGQELVTDWFNRNLGTEYANSPIPFLYHPYAGHDNNRDMYMFNLTESRLTANLVWHDWFPSVWLDEHEMARDGPRIFVMPATDPINPNVHPLIYRWNTILGQSQAAALEAEGKVGIIHNSTYTNFWEGAMAWSGWWHNEIGLLTEVAGVRIAAPTDQQRATLNQPAATGRRDSPVFSLGNLLPPPTDVTPRSDYPNPWLGGHWSLRDIVDYELTATMALLDTTADRREAILRQIYEVNRQTIEEGKKGNPSAVLLPATGQRDPREVAHLVEKLQMGGVQVYRADSAFTVDGARYLAGTFVIPMAQVFGRYAKDLLEVQKYPDVQPSPVVPSEPPYDVTAWTLGMQLGVRTEFVSQPLPDSLALAHLTEAPRVEGEVRGAGTRYSFPYEGADSAIAVNRLLDRGANIVLDATSSGARALVGGVSRGDMEAVARELGLRVAAETRAPSPDAETAMVLRVPRVGLYEPWNGDDVDAGWTRWVLEQYDFHPTTVHNSDVRAGNLRGRFDAIIFADQDPQDIMQGFNSEGIRPEYRGGIGAQGLEELQRFVGAGGSLILMGSACNLAIDRLPVPVRDLKKALPRDVHDAPGTLVRVQIDTRHPMGYGMPPSTDGFYNNDPFFTVIDGFTSWHTAVVARYPNTDVLASGWLKGDEEMEGRAAVVSIEMNPGRMILFGLEPQHRGQTHATFPLLFNALYMSAIDGPLPVGATQ
jgi:hypothetical protein